jgi:ABC-type transport system involved in cytochrome c biogenesis permease component
MSNRRHHKVNKRRTMPFWFFSIAALGLLSLLVGDPSNNNIWLTPAVIISVLILTALVSYISQPVKRNTPTRRYRVRD